MPVGTGDPDHIRGWQRLSDSITTSGKLDPDDPALLAELGVRHVVNLALDDHEEALADEAELLAAHGVRYTHIPIPFDAPTEEHYTAFREVLKSSSGPVHVHCIMNYRVSALFYLLNIEQGMAESDARGIMAQQWDPIGADHPAAEPWSELLLAHR